MQVPSPWRSALVTSCETARFTVSAALAAIAGTSLPRESRALSRASATGVAQGTGATLTLRCLCPGLWPVIPAVTVFASALVGVEVDYLTVEHAEICDGGSRHWVVVWLWFLS
ncbi:hypothetical protein GCM10009837_42500 [Streptomyces durmitorensis]